MKVWWCEVRHGFRLYWRLFTSWEVWMKVWMGWGWDTSLDCTDSHLHHGKYGWRCGWVEVRHEFRLHWRWPYVGSTCRHTQHQQQQPCPTQRTSLQLNAISLAPPYTLLSLHLYSGHSLLYLKLVITIIVHDMSFLWPCWFGRIWVFVAWRSKTPLIDITWRNTGEWVTVLHRIDNLKTHLVACNSLPVKLGQLTNHTLVVFHVIDPGSLSGNEKGNCQLLK